MRSHALRAGKRQAMSEAVVVAAAVLLCALLPGCASAPGAYPSAASGAATAKAPPGDDAAGQGTENPLPEAGTAEESGARGPAASPARFQGLLVPYNEWFGRSVVRAARELAGRERFQVRGQRFPRDCSGLVRAAYATVGCTGIELGGIPGGMSARIYNYCRTYGMVFGADPGPGDILFFNDTYDRDRNGRNDDPLTHSGIVTGVAADGTVTFIHVGSGKVKEGRLNLRQPSRARTGDGRVLNDYVREEKGRDPPGTRYLAGELFEAYCRLDPCGE